MDRPPKQKPKISASRRLFLKTKLLKKAMTMLENEKQVRKDERERTLTERVPGLQLSGLSLQDLQNLCKELHQKIDVVDEERYDIAAKVSKNEREIQDLSQKIFELKGKMKRPNLRRVRVSADAMLGALLGSKVKESVDFKANLKTVKKEEEKAGFNTHTGFLLLVLRMSKYKLFLLRHGEGAWNKENRFCSWVDQKLSEDGVKEAQDCGRLLKEQGYKFDLVFTSILSRSIQTAWLVLEAMGQEWVPVVKSWRLNERHYGSLIGLNRAEMALQHGEEKVKLWRRSYDITPPQIDESHPYFLEIYNDRRYTTCDVPKEDLPRAESLKEVLDRLLPYWDSTVVPEIRKGRTVLISAHGNSCRALLKHLEGISDEDIASVTLPTGIPVLLELDENLRPVKPRQLLGDQAKIQAAIKKVEDQGKAKPST
ncbi:bisphosphoglycerate mutase isoform X1 [Lates japonicus]|uniref:Phosphoglycerate mutase n=1 Tax=Lates japonicus TaxID=270547 RepID=A0AAD3MSV7_LATJO|nr:bisphosphoglycerate mutase isoform X1 [Lates japonicus]